MKIIHSALGGALALASIACGNGPTEPELVAGQAQYSSDETLRLSYKKSLGWHFYVAPGGLQFPATATFSGTAVAATHNANHNPGGQQQPVEPEPEESAGEETDLFGGVDGPTFSGAAVTTTSFSSSAGASSSYSASSPASDSFSSSSPAASAFTSETGLLAPGCDLSPICDFVEAVDPAAANECRSQINGAMVPANVAQLVCAFVAFIECIGPVTAELDLATAEACAAASGLDMAAFFGF